MMCISISIQSENQFQSNLHSFLFPKSKSSATQCRSDQYARAQDGFSLQQPAEFAATAAAATAAPTTAVVAVSPSAVAVVSIVVAVVSGVVAVVSIAVSAVMAAGISAAPTIVARGGVPRVVPSVAPAWFRRALLTAWSKLAESKGEVIVLCLFTHLALSLRLPLATDRSNKVKARLRDPFLWLPLSPGGKFTQPLS